MEISLENLYVDIGTERDIGCIPLGGYGSRIMIQY